MFNLKCVLQSLRLSSELLGQSHRAHTHRNLLAIDFTSLDGLFRDDLFGGLLSDDLLGAFLDDFLDDLSFLDGSFLDDLFGLFGSDLGLFGTLFNFFTNNSDSPIMIS